MTTESQLSLVDDLAAAVSEVATDELSRLAASTDRSGSVADGLPLAVVRAHGVADVQAAMRIASAHRVPVVPRGAGTGLAGGAVAGTGHLVVDLSAMDRILELDPVDEIAVVEPGVLTARLDAAAAEVGLRFAPDPASAAISTIGGNVATNAGGLRCVKYGVTREAVIGLDVVLADGTLVHTGRRTMKGVAGLDLTALFVGSEGTLGIVVGATVRLKPRPLVTTTASAAYASVAAAARACAEIAAARRLPSMLELIDRRCLEAIDRFAGTAYASHGDALVIAQADGPAAASEIEAIAAVLGKEATWIEQGVDEESSDRLVATRRQILPAIETEGAFFIEDICVPRSRLAEAVERISEIADRHLVRIYTIAHAGDGNLHPVIGWDPSPDDVPGVMPPAETAAGDEIFGLALELGGTTTGEHGVGRLKRGWLEPEVGAASIDVHQRIKAALDPLGILNPGVGF
ncbi:FAD-binding oxidoreductase [Nocardioides luteus]|uniref:FAD-binding oxidoreductase n=1 Tax=Nocardioides luteus TaxID=1844 RepID=A0A1J4N360_9ACTN|nr:FAD-linked oxidase C-terminal domain-containing protein [Nocardioides luteus]OIJ25990.1 FAD-binding oxidoreductase [Nocardioides luteus]